MATDREDIENISGMVMASGILVSILSPFALLATCLAVGNAPPKELLIAFGAIALSGFVCAVGGAVASLSPVSKLIESKVEKIESGREKT